MTVLTVSSRPPDDFFAVATLDLDFIIGGAASRRAAIKPAVARCVKFKDCSGPGPVLSAARRRFRRSWKGADNHDGLREGRLVSQAEVETGYHAGRRDRLEPPQRAAGQKQARLSGRQVDDAE